MVTKNKKKVETGKGEPREEAIVETNEETVQISKSQLEAINKKLEMLEAVADKGRIHNYENQNVAKKPMKVKLSIFQDCIIVGWRTVLDELLKNPSTGVTAGERQEYEVMLLDGEGKTKTVRINGYPQFSSARYDQRIEATVTGKSESFEGELSYNLELEDGRQLTLNARFVN